MTMTPQDPDLAALFGRIPQGWSRREYQGRHYGVTRTVSAGGRIQKIFAEQLGGSDIVSANLYLGNRFRPCEMPGEQVVSFLSTSTAAPAVVHPGGPTPAAGTMSDAHSHEVLRPCSADRQ